MMIEQENLKKRTNIKIKFEILENPKAQKRHKHRIIESKSGKSFAQIYDPSASDKKTFMQKLMGYAPEIPLKDVALRVDFCFVFPRPSSHYGTGKNANKLKPSAPASHFHIQRPDVDNLRKFCMDAMSGIFWHDDRQVCCGYTKKMWGSMPRILGIITVL